MDNPEGKTALSTRTVLPGQPVQAPQVTSNCAAVCAEAIDKFVWPPQGEDGTRVGAISTRHYSPVFDTEQRSQAQYGRAVLVP